MDYALCSPITVPSCLIYGLFLGLLFIASCWKQMKSIVWRSLEWDALRAFLMQEMKKKKKAAIKHIF